MAVFSDSERPGIERARELIRKRLIEKQAKIKSGEIPKEFQSAQRWVCRGLRVALNEIGEIYSDDIENGLPR